MEWCDWNGGEEVRGCPEALHSVVAAKSSEAGSVEHMQQVEKGYSGCIV